MTKIQPLKQRDMNVGIRRVYVPPGPQDGYRVLVDRLWPRGLSRSDATIDAWWKEIAPSTSLRKWFGHQPTKWLGFKQRYTGELEANREEVVRFINEVGNGPITLVYGSKNEEYNQAVVLKEFMDTRILKTLTR